MAVMSAIFVTGLVGAFKEYEPCRLLCERALDTVEILDREHRVCHAEAAEQAANDVARRIVGLDEAQHMIALLGEREQSVGDRAHACTGREAIVAPL